MSREYNPDLVYSTSSSQYVAHRPNPPEKLIETVLEFYRKVSSEVNAACICW